MLLPLSGVGLTANPKPSHHHRSVQRPLANVRVSGVLISVRTTSEHSGAHNILPALPDWSAQDFKPEHVLQAIDLALTPDKMVHRGKLLEVQ